MMLTLEPETQKQQPKVEIDYLAEIDKIRDSLGTLVANMRNTKSLDQRWVGAGALDLQMGLMALERSVIRPTKF